MRNIEIKAHYADLEKARKIARQYHTEYLGILHQVDTYFTTKWGRLKLREINGKTAQLIPYIKNYQIGPMRSDYALLPVEDPVLVKHLLSYLLGIEFVIDKQREVFLIENVRVHLDQVVRMGNFLEFEAVCAIETDEYFLQQTKKVNDLMKIFAVSPDDLVEMSYVDYMTSGCRSDATTGAELRSSI